MLMLAAITTPKIELMLPVEPPNTIASPFDVKVSISWGTSTGGGFELKYTFLSPHSQQGAIFYQSDYNVTEAIVGTPPTITKSISVPTTLYNAVLVVALIQVIPGANPMVPPTVTSYDTKSKGPYTFTAPTAPPPPPPIS
jgi:hypothetical protein